MESEVEERLERIRGELKKTTQAEIEEICRLLDKLKQEHDLLRAELEEIALLERKIAAVSDFTAKLKDPKDHKPKSPAAAASQAPMEHKITVQDKLIVGEGLYYLQLHPKAVADLVLASKDPHLVDFLCNDLFSMSHVARRDYFRCELFKALAHKDNSFPLKPSDSQSDSISVPHSIWMEYVAPACVPSFYSVKALTALGPLIVNTPSLDADRYLHDLGNSLIAIANIIHCDERIELTPTKSWALLIRLPMDIFAMELKMQHNLQLHPSTLVEVFHKKPGLPPSILKSLQQLNAYKDSGLIRGDIYNALYERLLDPPKKADLVNALRAISHTLKQTGHQKETFQTCVVHGASRFRLKNKGKVVAKAKAKDWIATGILQTSPTTPAKFGKAAIEIASADQQNQPFTWKSSEKLAVSFKFSDGSPPTAVILNLADLLFALHSQQEPLMPIPDTGMSFVVPPLMKFIVEHLFDS